MKQNIQKWQASAFVRSFNARGIDDKKFKELYAGGSGGSDGLYDCTLLFQTNIGGRRHQPGAVKLKPQSFRELAQEGWVKEVHHDETLAAYDKDVAEFETAQAAEEAVAEGEDEGDDKGKKGRKSRKR